MHYALSRASAETIIFPRRDAETSGYIKITFQLRYRVIYAHMRARKSGGAFYPFAWNRILYEAMMINRKVDRLYRGRAGVYVEPRESGRGAVVDCRL